MTDEGRAARVRCPEVQRAYDAAVRDGYRFPNDGEALAAPPGSPPVLRFGPAADEGLEGRPDR